MREVGEEGTRQRKRHELQGARQQAALAYCSNARRPTALGAATTESRGSGWNCSWQRPVNQKRNLLEGHTMKKHLLWVALAGSLFASAGANAMTKDEYNVAKEKISADYKVAKAKCDTLKNNAKDVCEKEAKGTEKVARAELEQAYKP